MKLFITALLITAFLIWILEPTHEAHTIIGGTYNCQHIDNDIWMCDLGEQL